MRIISSISQVTQFPIVGAGIYVRKNSDWESVPQNGIAHSALAGVGSGSSRDLTRLQVFREHLLGPSRGHTLPTDTEEQSRFGPLAHLHMITLRFIAAGQIDADGIL